jgi:putative RecB family exonuclease
MIAPVSAIIAKEKAPDILEKVSASRLQCFHQCRLKFYFRYVLGLKKPKTSALFVGSMVHLVLQAWNLARWRQSNVGTLELKVQFESNWTLEQEDSPIKWDDGEETASKQGAWAMLETYFTQTPITPDEKPEAVEVQVEADLYSHGLPRLVGIIDLVRKGGRIVDFKTSSQTPNPEKAEHLHETQLSCYSLLYREATGKQESGLELHHLVKLKTPKLVVTTMTPMTQVQETRLFRVMESYVSGVQREDWVPSPSVMSCSSCEFFNECRRWNGS